MSLSIYHSSDYGWLLGQLTAQESRTQSALADPFAQTQIWLASNADEWEIRRAFANAHGIAANLNFSPLAEGLWASCSQILGGMANRSPFGAPALRPLVFEITETRFRENHPLWQWLPSTQSQRMVVAGQVAQYFARYVTYRQDMLLGWTRAGLSTQVMPWQQDLWQLLGQRIVEIAKPHPFTLLKSKVGAQSFAQAKQTIHLFNPLGLAPLYESAIETLSQIQDVAIYFFNPSPGNWHDRADALPRMMAALGNERRYAFERHALWLNSGIAKEIAFYPVAIKRSQAGVQSVLPKIAEQFHSLELATAEIAADETSLLEATDLRLHSCSSIAEQLSAVKASIEQKLLADQNFSLADALVLLARHSDYQKSIRLLPWLWSEGYSEAISNLPYRLSGIAYEIDDELVQNWQRLLQLLQSEFELDAMFEWLASSPVSSRLGLDQDDLLRFKEWAQAAGIRRTLKSDIHSWQQGLDWLLLSYAGTLPAHEMNDITVSGLELELLGSLVGELAQFERFTQNFQTPKAAKEWSRVLVELFDALVYFEGCELVSEGLIREAIASVATIPTENFLLEFSAVSAYLLTDTNVLDSSVLRANLQRAPVVTVAPLGALRGQSFKAIYIVGAEQIPIAVTGNESDLMVSSPERGDPSLREADLCSVLDAFVACKGSLEIGFLGKNPVSQAVLAQPMLVSLIKQVAKDHGYKLNDQSVLLNSANTLTRLDDNQLPIGLAAKRILDLPQAATDGSKDLALLLHLADPLRSYLRYELGVSSFDEDNSLDATEPFELNNLELWQRRSDVLADDDALPRRSTPQGRFGGLIVKEADEQMRLAQAFADDIDRAKVVSRAMRWGLLIESIVQILSEDSKPSDQRFTVIARDSFVTLHVGDASQLLEALWQLRALFFRAPFVFGRVAALEFCKAIYDQDPYPWLAWAEMSESEANAYLLTKIKPTFWGNTGFNKDGLLSHDILWAQHEVDEMPLAMCDWLLALAKGFAKAKLSMRFGASIELAQWVQQ
jgi:exonuclease V gamma subunit